MLSSIKLSLACLICILVQLWITSYAQAQAPVEDFLANQIVFSKQQFTSHDALLVTNSFGDIVYQWQGDKALIPASLTKLLTANLAIKKWGLDHRFVTEFHIVENQLWVKGFGDPYLVSQELDLIAAQIVQLLSSTGSEIESIHIDSSAIAREPVPGRTQAVDPYNAPLSAVAANFNTVMLQRISGSLVSAEPQTPLTATAKDVANKRTKTIGAKPSRINLIDPNRAQQHFAQLLSIKLDLYQDAKPSVPVKKLFINQMLPSQTRLLLRYQNSKTLADVLRGALEYSNNFIANQLYLLLAQDETDEQLNFAKSDAYVKQKLAGMYAKPQPRIDDGAGLARSNRVSARQLNQVLTELEPYQNLLKRYNLKTPKVSSANSTYARAKTGTLNGVHSFAGFLTVDQRHYQFVFMFNRKTPYRYREQLLQLLADQIVSQ
ncbi:MAG: D-alanyl-D-alanine carboxypeptidase/D-alanyl-D-alanine-endopeptidase (penicillin-binding protein 4) [Arenicella sp.]|jgi:D-alanyl-D-alanine carboxypeptidase/D-alanyl-D-alanine-endopeptidase (penicillin-binding protein 4)